MNPEWMKQFDKLGDDLHRMRELEERRLYHNAKMELLTKMTRLNFVIFLTNLIITAICLLEQVWVVVGIGLLSMVLISLRIENTAKCVEIEKENKS